MTPVTSKQLTDALKSIELTEVCGQLDKFIDKAGELFYDGDRPCVSKQYYLVPQVIVSNGSIPNGNLTPFGESHWGVEISRGLLSMKEKLARDFALGHEMGHGISEQVLTKMGMTGVGGTATEVVADLLSAYVWHRCGVNWTQMLGSIVRAQDQIFDRCKNGDHPAGKNRISYVSAMFMKLDKSKGTQGFYDASKLVLKGL